MSVIPVHPAMAELSDDDRDRLYLDDSPRWVGPTAPSGRYIDLVRYCVGDAAQRLADLVVDGGGDEWTLERRGEDYLRYRAQQRQIEVIDQHRYATGAEGFAGWIVR